MGNSKNTPPVSTVVNRDGAESRHPTYADVGQKNTSKTTCPEDAIREDAIRQAGARVEFFYSERGKAIVRYERDGLIDDLADADACMQTAREALLQMRNLITARRPEYVARLEAERGIS